MDRVLSKELREKVEARIGLFLGLMSAHTERLFVVISCEKISERFYIGANVSAHEPIFNLWQRLFMIVLIMKLMLQIG